MLLTLTACASSPTRGQSIASGHDAEIEAWRSQRVANLTRDTGWLTLAGLHPLAEGRQTLGSAPESDIVLPASAPPEVGALLVAEGRAALEINTGVAIASEGEPWTGGPLATDAEEDTTMLEIGPVNFFVIERGEELLLRVRDRAHPARESFAGIDYFPIDEAWRFDATFEAHDPVRQIPIANIIGMVSDSPNWGAVVFEHEGATYKIDALAEPGDEELFLIFADETSGHETYGAGRYLYVDAPDENGRIDLDFNRAYNPPCAFTAFATCPLPPRQNRLALRIEAGEKNYSAAEH
jgi:uncharacterized protein (DUF1684 family)